MKVALFQMDCAWENAPANCLCAEAWIEAQDADIVVLPEMFSTGFTMSPQRVAERMDGSTVQWLCSTAKRSGKAIVCSIAIAEGDNYYNRLFFVAPDGEYEIYDKRHLFRMGGEHNVYKSGNQRVIVQYKGWRICLLTCYDLRFPVWSRNRGDYDLLIYVASWPEPRRYVWSTLLRARAIENQSYVIGANRVGSDPNCVYSGDSVVIDFMGQSIAEAEPGVIADVVTTLDLTALREFRDKFPAYLDADTFTIEIETF